jgi:DNA-binding SARP family transcriptional activator/tetratricopeptide (TPR) repeat protein
MVGQRSEADDPRIDNISVRILGPLEIERGGRLIELSGRRERAVLALLLVHAGHSVSLDRMTEDLWEGDPPASAITTLRAHVSRVRKALASGGVDDLLVTHDAGYSVRVDAVSLDAAEFEAGAEEGRRLLEAGDADAAARRLRAALRLWRGAPFGDVGSSSFARAEVTRLEEAFKTAREDRIEADLVAGRHRELCAELDALVVEEPLRERLWGQRMLALYRSGRQAEALRAYTQLRTSLAEHLGILPSPALQQLEVAMLCQDPVLEAPVRPRATSPAVSAHDGAPAVPSDDDEVCLPPPLPAELCTTDEDTVFVGREEELDHLERAWAKVEGGTAQRVFLAGEPGIGKTTLASAVAARAAAGGGAVLLGRCDRDALTPYQPFVEALRRFVQTCSSGCLARQSTSDLREVGRLVPELAERVPGLQPRAAAEDADRFGLFEAVTAFLTTVAAAHPLVLVLDDLHWADKPTCLLLRHLVRRAPQAPILLLGTSRDVDLTADHPLTDVLADLRRETSVDRIHLTGLDEGDIADLVTSMAGAGIGSAAPMVADTLRRETGGNPFFVREVVRHLQRSDAPPERWGHDLARGEAGLPESVREVVGRRISALSAKAGGALTLASVIGATFDLETLQAVGELDAIAVLDAVDEAAAAGIVVEVHRQAGWYAFSHSLIREVIYGSLSTARRLRLHRAVGEALEHRTGPDAPSHQVLAHHFLEAGPSGDAQEKAILYSEWASSAAMEQLAYEEAVDYLERALEVQAQCDEPDPATKIDLLVLLGHAHWRIGTTMTTATFERAAEEARALGDGERFARAVVGLGLDAGGFAASIRANEDLIVLMEEALEGVGSEDSELRVRLLSRLAIERYFTPRRQEGRLLSAQALAIADRLEDPRARLVALHAQAWATFAPSEPPGHRLGQVAEISALAEQLGDHEMSYRAEVLRQQTLLEIGDAAGAEASVARMEQLVSDQRMPRFSPWVRSHQATGAFIAGRLEEADRLTVEALDDAMQRGTETEAALALIGGQQMAVRIYRDGLEPFAEALESMVDALDRQDVVVAMLPVLYLELDRPEEARAAYKVAAARRALVPRDGTWLIYAWALGISCRLGDGTTWAEELYTELLPYADRWAVATPSICFGPISLGLAGYASCLGWHDAALAHAESGLASARAQSAPVFTAAALVAQAECLVSRAQPGDREAARAALDEADPICDRLRLTTLAARSARLREQG